jgi:hypothetical protein
MFRRRDQFGKMYKSRNFHRQGSGGERPGGRQDSQKDTVSGKCCGGEFRRRRA